MSNRLRDNDNRPSPDALLTAARQEDARHRGRLKIFLGAAPGVGKTYTMLEAARARAIAGEDVLVGVVESHGRTETAELLLGLEIVPRRRIEYAGRTLEEMDLDAILERRPALALVDELAHTNAPGSRHEKRFVDVEELLAAGIDVYTTLNVQHVESMNDAVAQITGVRVRETVPDRIVERADELELVDLSVDDLLARLRQGKVYVPEQAGRALDNFFRPGNLSALRQIALRLVAEHVDDDMHTYMRAHAIPGPWPVAERLVVSVSPSPFSARLVRATCRRAERRRAEWIALYVETPRHHRLSNAERDRVAATLRLAMELGGESATVPGDDVAAELLRFARTRNATEIVVGRSLRPWWFVLAHGSIVERLVRTSGDIDVHVIGADAEPEKAPAATARERPQYDRYLRGGALVAAATALSAVLSSVAGIPNVSLIFLLAVLLCAVRWGLRVSMLASALSVLAYDFFFVEPVLTFSIARAEDVLALAVFMIVATIASNMAGRIRDQERAARDREERTAALYELSRAIAAASSVGDVARAVVEQMAEHLEARVGLLLPEGELLRLVESYPAFEITERERAAASWVWRNGQLAGHGSAVLPGEAMLYVPMRAAAAVVGVLAIRFDDAAAVLSPDRQRLIESMAGQASVAIERAVLAEAVERARLAGERERLQAILLSSISHDLRTPLATILGSTTTLIEHGQALDAPTRGELLAAIQDETERLNRFVGNLLDTARLESGAVGLKREWADITDIIGSALARTVRQTSGHEIRVDVAPDVPMVHADFVLMEQAMVNLIDNAAKYSPAGSTIDITARREGGGVVVAVRDEGRGIPAEDLERVFDKFHRVEQGDRQAAGTGLGLSIVRGILEAHGGRIVAASSGAGCGATFTMELPAAAAPPTPVEVQ